MTNPSSSAPDDQQHLRLLSIFHYVDAGLSALFSCIFLVHLVMGLFMVFAPDSMGGKPGDQPPQVFGWLFTCMGAGMFLVGQTIAVCTALAGRFIARRKRYWFIFVMACIQCSFFPFGTALGILTIVTLSRESVKTLFADRNLSAPVA
jgi:hypothetical protein